MSETQFPYRTADAEPYDLPSPDTAHILRFTIPMPVSANNAYPTNFKTGYRYTSKAAADFKAETGLIARSTANACGWEAGSGLLGLRLDLWFPLSMRHRRVDIDGKIKLPMDAIAEALAFDDSRIHELHVYRAGIDDPSCCVVTLWKI